MATIEIEFLGEVQNAHGSFAAGDRATLPDYDAEPIIAAGGARRVEPGAEPRDEEPAPSPPRRRKPIEPA